MDGQLEREDQALVEEPAPGVLIHMVYGHLHIDCNYKYVCMCGEGGLHTQISPRYGYIVLYNRELCMRL